MAALGRPPSLSLPVTPLRQGPWLRGRGKVPTQPVAAVKGGEVDPRMDWQVRPIHDNSSSGLSELHGQETY